MEQQPISRKQRLQLGQRVKVHRQICPCKNWAFERKWLQRPIFNNQGTQIEPEGIIAGVRTVYEGKSTLIDDLGAIEWEPQKAIGVYLVAIHLGRILRALPEDLTALTEAGVAG